MGVRQVVTVCAAIAMMTAAGGQAWSPVNAWTGAASSSIDVARAELPVCGEVAVPGDTSRKGPGQAVSRAGTIPGLGPVAASIDWDGRQQLVLHGGEFQVTRTFAPTTRQVEIVISGRDEIPVEVRFGGTDGFSITKGAQVLRGTAEPDAIRGLVSGRAVEAFRERVGTYERRLISGGLPARVDDVHADGFLLAGAFVGSLAGDPTAVGRARDLISRRVRGPVRNARLQFKDCVRDYEKYLLMIDDQRTGCLQAADGRDSWYARAADRLGCEIEFMAGALAGEGQFVSCTALGAIVT